MSVAGIVFMLGMSVFSIRYFAAHIKQDTENAERCVLMIPAAEGQSATAGLYWSKTRPLMPTPTSS